MADKDNNNFKKLTEKYKNELLTFYQKNRPTVIPVSQQDVLRAEQQITSPNPEPKFNNSAENNVDTENEGLPITGDEIPEIQPGDLPDEIESNDFIPPSPETIEIEEAPEPPAENEIKEEKRGKRKEVKREMCGEDPMRMTNSLEDTSDDFDRYTEIGYIKIRAFTASKAIPISGAEVVISKEVDGDPKIHINLTTGQSGNTNTVSVPAPPKELSQAPEQGIKPYGLYNIVVKKDGYETIQMLNVPVFSGVVSIQPVELIPLSANGVLDDEEIVDEQQSQTL